MRAPKLFALIVCLVLSSCGTVNVGGTFPGVQPPPVEVSLADLSRYYTHRSHGLIKYVFHYSDDFVDAMKFVWDPYNKMRVFPSSSLSTDVLQGLFEFDEEEFVRRSSARDFLGAAYQSYSRRPFDPLRQMHARDYRYISAWGNLFHPPIKELKRPLAFYHENFTADFDPKTAQSIYFDPDFQKRLDEETQTELTYGNEVRALFNGVQSYPAKLALTSQAKKFLYVAVMTIVCDETGQELVRNMVAAKRAGVDVRFITEGLYAISISNYCVGVLEREGIPVVRVNDKTIKRLDRVFHNKIWIRDGEEAILGGMNILNYENNADGFNFLNRDSDIWIKGPAVTSLLDSFIKLWKKYDKDNRPITLGEETLARQLADERARGVRGSENYARWLGNPETRMNGICRTAVQGNNAEPQKIVTLLTRYMEAAQHSFYITSPDIDVDLETTPPRHLDVLARLMVEKVRNPKFYLAFITNGIDGGLGETSAFVRSRVNDSQMIGETFWEDMLTPEVDAEGRDVNRHTRIQIEPMVRAGVHGFQYFNYIHAKEYYFDRILAGIGSWNFSGFSSENNHESAIFCLDEKLRQQMEQQMVLDMINSTPVVFTKP